MFRYWLHGLVVECRFPLPELVPYRDGLAVADPDPVRIEYGTVPATIEGAQQSKEGFWLTRSEALAHLDNIASFHIVDGCTITVQPRPSTKLPWLRLFLLSGAMGCALHQRGCFPLHAAAVVTRNGCVAFCGTSGDGKSTLASGLASRHHTLMTDDRLCVTHSTTGELTAWPGLPILHLYEEAALQTSRTSLQHSEASWRFGKYVHTAQAQFTQAPARLRRIYFLDWCGPDEEAGIAPLTASDAFWRMRRDISLDGVVQLMGHEANYMAWASRVCEQLQFYSLKRPKDFSRFSDFLDRLCLHLV